MEWRVGLVALDGHNAVIDSARGSYSVHFGSPTMQVLPGRTLLIVAVHSQYRGRLFLPFADDDRKTSVVLAKTLLLAGDDQIKDPSILAKIRHRIAGIVLAERRFADGLPSRRC